MHVGYHQSNTEWHEMNMYMHTANQALVNKGICVLMCNFSLYAVNCRQVVLLNKYLLSTKESVCQHVIYPKIVTLPHCCWQEHYYLLSLHSVIPKAMYMVGDVLRLLWFDTNSIYRYPTELFHWDWDHPWRIWVNLSHAVKLSSSLW